MMIATLLATNETGDVVASTATEVCVNLDGRLVAAECVSAGGAALSQHFACNAGLNECRRTGVAAPSLGLRTGIVAVLVERQEASP